LREGAASPATDVDLGGVMREARGRRRRRGIGVVVGALVLAVATLGVVRAADDEGGSSARIAIGPRQSSEAPEGWTRVELESGIRFAMPPAWDVFDFGTTPEVVKRISVGTGRPTDESLLSACTTAVGQIPTQPGTWIALWEYPTSSGPQVTGPEGGDTLEVVDRPADFATTGVSGSCQHAGDDEQSALGAGFEIEAFRDAGRVFVARVVTAYPVGGTPDFTEANRVLNTLRISPLEPTTTVPATTVPAPIVVPAPATTVPPFVPATTDEQEITTLFLSWLRGQTDDEIRATFEDAESLIDAIHEGMAQHSVSDLTKYSGLVNAIRMIDADHASVDYTLLFAGQPQFGVRTGTAVRIDGAWKVSRDTECALLALGNVTCPGRVSP
jgi:hypothetical protein